MMSRGLLAGLCLAIAAPSGRPSALGDAHDARRAAGDFLKALPPGSVYSELAGRNHLAETGDAPVIVHLVRYGPTDTRHLDAANDPAKR